MAGLCPGAERRFLHLHEIADKGILFQHCPRAQPGKGADLRARTDARAFDMAEALDPCPIGNCNARTEYDIRLNHNVATQPGVMAEEDGFRRDQRCAIGQRGFTARSLPRSFGSSEFAAAVDPGYFARIIAYHHRASPAVSDRDIDDVRQVIFALRIVIADPREQREQIFAPGGEQARVTQTARTLFLASILEFDHFGYAASIVGNDAAIMPWIGGLEAQNHTSGLVCAMQTLQHRAHCFRANEWDISVKHEHITAKSGERILRLLHSVACAQLRLLRDGFSPTPNRPLNLICLVADHDNGLFRCQLVQRCKQMVKHRPSSNRVQHLVQVALHSCALARSKNDRS